MMAEYFGRIFRKFLDNQKVNSRKCEHEVDFHELFEAKGDAAKQKTIRNANPNAKHCDDLIVNPYACIKCPNNPIRKAEEKEKKEVKKEELEEQEMQDIDIALNLYDAIDMGLVRDLRDITPEEWVCVRTVHAHFRSMKGMAGLL